MSKHKTAKRILKTNKTSPKRTAAAIKAIGKVKPKWL